MKQTALYILGIAFTAVLVSCIVLNHPRFKRLPDYQKQDQDIALIKSQLNWLTLDYTQRKHQDSLHIVALDAQLAQERLLRQPLEAKLDSLVKSRATNAPKKLPIR